MLIAEILFSIQIYLTILNRVKLGRFTWSNVGLKLSDCNGDFNTAVHNEYPDKQGEVELQWQAPSDYLGDVFFT